MYSIVMLTAMSAGADVTPAPAPAAAAPVAVGYGCAGSCYGSGYAACYGSCYGSGSGCYGSCHGCYGSGVMRMRTGGGILGRASCHGCSGYSCSGYNCFGSCYGSYIASYASCHGCSGSFLVGYSWGPSAVMPPYSIPGYGCHGALSPHAVYGHVTNPNQPPVMMIPPAPEPKPESGSDKNPQGANLRFTLPKDAKLFVDGKPAPGDGAERAFYTPPLTPGQKFFYDVKAELMVDGKLVTEEKRVVVEAGANLTEAFPKLVAAVAAAGTVAEK